MGPPGPTDQRALRSGVFGSHLSIAGGMHNALLEAERLGLDCVQVFTKNQQQWSAPPLSREAINAWSSELSRLGWAPPADGSAPHRVTSHASYLINMASPDEALREKSIGLMRDEIERCEALAIPLLVFHPGASTTGTPEAGVSALAGACARLIAETAGFRTVLCLENVAGAGSALGRTFEQLAELRARIVEATGAPGRVGFCIDTCHAHAAGYDLSTPGLALEALRQLESHCGLASVRALHVNDSKGACGSRLDRHEHIGQGTIGGGGGGVGDGGGFAAFVGCPAWRTIPKIMETPKGDSPDGLAWDLINVRRLRAMLDPAGASAPGPAVSARTPAKAGAKPKTRTKTKANTSPKAVQGKRATAKSAQAKPTGRPAKPVTPARRGPSAAAAGSSSKRPPPSSSRRRPR